jgi:uncharacterized protein (TIGR02996 family)
MLTADQLTIERVYELAPDAQGAQAGLKLVQQQRFSSLAVAADRLSLSARCQGSEPRPYTVEVELSTREGELILEPHCNCASYKWPCKHVLGLLLAYVQAPQQFRVVPAPERESLPAAPVPATDQKKDEGVVLPSREEMEAAFLRAIREAPDDVTPRLIYADWLQENGDPERGEFIHVQCEQSRPDLEETRRPILRQREEQLLANNRKAWLAPLPNFLRRMQPEFRRGFVEAITTAVNPFVSHAEELFEAAPVRAAHFLPLRPPGRYRPAALRARVAALAGSPFLARLTRLDLPNNDLDAKLLEMLLTTPYVRNIRALNLHGNELGHAGIRRLAEATFLTSLTELDLSATVGPAAILILAETPWLAQLTVLDLRGNRLDTEAAQMLAASPHLADLQRLSVSESAISPAGRKALRERFGPRLREDTV